MPVRRDHYIRDVDWQRAARVGFLVVVATLVVTAQAQVWSSDASAGRHAGYAAVALRSRLRGDRPPNPLGVARMAVLGKASAHVGPIVGGCYLGYLLVLLPGLEITSRQERAVISGVALVAAILLTGAGLWLERTCRVRGGDPDLLDEPDLIDPFD